MSTIHNFHFETVAASSRALSKDYTIILCSSPHSCAEGVWDTLDSNPESIVPVVQVPRVPERPARRLHHGGRPVRPLLLQGPGVHHPAPLHQHFRFRLPDPAPRCDWRRQRHAHPHPAPERRKPLPRECAVARARGHHHGPGPHHPQQ